MTVAEMQVVDLSRLAWPSKLPMGSSGPWPPDDRPPPNTYFVLAINKVPVRGWITHPHSYCVRNTLPVPPFFFFCRGSGEVFLHLSDFNSEWFRIRQTSYISYEDFSTRSLLFRIKEALKESFDIVPLFQLILEYAIAPRITEYFIEKVPRQISVPPSSYLAIHAFPHRWTPPSLVPTLKPEDRLPEKITREQALQIVSPLGNLLADKEIDGTRSVKLQNLWIWYNKFGLIATGYLKQIATKKEESFCFIGSLDAPLRPFYAADTGVLVNYRLSPLCNQFLNVGRDHASDSYLANGTITFGRNVYMETFWINGFRALPIDWKEIPQLVDTLAKVFVISESLKPEAEVSATSSIPSTPPAPQPNPSAAVDPALDSLVDLEPPPGGL